MVAVVAVGVGVAVVVGVGKREMDGWAWGGNGGGMGCAWWKRREAGRGVAMGTASDAMRPCSRMLAPLCTTSPASPTAGALCLLPSPRGRPPRWPS